jgi:hypothetical protein
MRKRFRLCHARSNFTAVAVTISGERLFAYFTLLCACLGVASVDRNADPVGMDLASPQGLVFGLPSLKVQAMRARP